MNMVDFPKSDFLRKLNECPLCSSKDIIHRFTTTDEEHHVVDQKFDIFLCKRCKAYFINPVPNKDVIHTFYQFNNNSSYGAYQEINPKIEYNNVENLLINKKNLTSIDRVIFAFMGIDNRILDLLTYTKKKKRFFCNVLDVGCGSGFFTMWLVKFLQLEKKNIKGIDIYPGVEEFGKKLGITMERSRIEKYPGSGFDLITLSHVLEHEPDPKTMIKKIHKRLCNDGIFYLSIPNSQSLPARMFGKKWICHTVPRHIYNFSKESIIRITKDLFELEYYSSGRFYTFMFDRYYKSKLLEIFFNNPLLSRLFDGLFLLLNIGDNQSFIFKKNVR